MNSFLERTTLFHHHSQSHSSLVQDRQAWLTRDGGGINVAEGLRITRTSCAGSSSKWVSSASHYSVIILPHSRKHLSLLVHQEEVEGIIHHFKLFSVLTLHGINWFVKLSCVGCNFFSLRTENFEREYFALFQWLSNLEDHIPSGYTSHRRHAIVN